MKKRSEKIDSNFSKVCSEYNITNISNMSVTKYYLSIQFEKKEEAKFDNAKWSPIAKLWYVLDDKSLLIEKYKIIQLDVKYKEKDYAKELGAKFNFENKEWYCKPEDNPLLIE
jgi:O-glycosyl hydrolase